MLTDQEIKLAALAHLRTAYGNVPLPATEPARKFDLIKEFELLTPAGVYFTVRLTSKLDQGEPRHPLDGMILGDQGFFVDRTTGTVRHFESREVSSASQAVTGSPITLNATDRQHVIEYLLNHPPGACVVSSRKWWQFWK